MGNSPVVTIEDITPKNSPKNAKKKNAEQLVIVGMKGSGKSTLMEKVFMPISKKEPVFIFDSKPEYTKLAPWWQPASKNPYKRLYPWMRLKDIKSGIWVYQTQYPDHADPAAQSLFLRILKREDCTVIIDETMDFVKGSYISLPLAKLIREGRSKNIRIILGGQRCAGMPLLALTEAMKVIAFRLRSSEDRKRLMQYVDPKMGAIPGPGPHDFWFRDDSRQGSEAILVHQPE